MPCGFSIDDTSKSIFTRLSPTKTIHFRDLFTITTTTMSARTRTVEPPVAPLPTTPGGDIAHDLAALHIASDLPVKVSPLSEHNLKLQDGLHRGKLQSSTQDTC